MEFDDPPRPVAGRDEGGRGIITVPHGQEVSSTMPTYKSCAPVGVATAIMDSPVSGFIGAMRR